MIPLLFAASLVAPQLNLDCQTQDPPPDGSVSIFVHTGVNMGEVRVFDEAIALPGFPQVAQVPPGLASIRLLEIDFVGRTVLTEFAENSPRYQVDVPNATRLSLPHGNGSLFKFERMEEGGGKTFGYLHIDADGKPNAIAERPGWGDQSDLDPYLSHVSVAPDGTAFIAATFFEAGGNLYEISLRGKEEVAHPIIDRTANHPELNFSRYGLGLQSDWGVAVTQRGVLRFDRNPTAQAVLMDFGPALWFMGDVVFSQNGDYVATIAGAELGSAHVYAFDRTSAPKRISFIPARYSRAGFLPEFAGGPFMAVSDDGKLVAWRRELEDSRELFIGRGPATSQVDSEQVTRELYFDDTLDEIGQTMFYRPDRLTFMAGARDYIHTGMEQADLFEVEMPEDSSSLVVRNVSLTSQELTPPFVAYGSIDPARVVWAPVFKRFLIYDDEDHQCLYSVDPSSVGLQVVLDEIRKLDLLIVTNQGLLFDARRTEAAGSMRELYRYDLFSAPPPILISAAPDDTEYNRPAVRRDGWVALVAQDDVGQVLSKVNIGTGVLQNFALTSQSYGPALGYTSHGSVLFSLDGPGGTNFMLWPFGCTTGTPLQSSPMSGFVLPAH